MSTAAPKVSVVMASYNHEAFVREAIESVLSQSYQDFELVITDDGSTDGTVKAIQGVADPRIRLNVFGENRGACVAVNDALTRARGNYIAVLNSDDYFLPGKLEKQVAFLDANPGVGAVFGLPQFINQHGELLGNNKHFFSELFTDKNGSRAEWLRRFFYTGNCLCHPTVLIRKACYDVIGTFDPLLMQLPDLDLWVRLCSRYDIHVLPEQVTAFRILDGEQNTSASNPEKLARCAWELSSVLGRYTECPQDLLREVFRDSPFEDARRTPLMTLAMEAIERGQPGYAPFGFNLLMGCLKTQPDLLPVGDYFRLVGRHDPASAEFFRYGHQWLKRSRTVSALRKFRRWCSL